MTTTDSNLAAQSAPPTTGNAWLVVGVAVFPAQILASAFEGGILETQANIAPGTWTSLKVSNGIDVFAINIHIVKSAAGKVAFRLYGTDGIARGMWEALVREMRSED